MTKAYKMPEPIRRIAIAAGFGECTFTPVRCYEMTLWGMPKARLFAYKDKSRLLLKTKDGTKILVESYDNGGGKIYRAGKQIAAWKRKAEESDAIYDALHILFKEGTIQDD